MKPLRQRTLLVLVMTLAQLSLRSALSHEPADARAPQPPIYGAYPTAGPVRGGTTVTIAGSDFRHIVRFVEEARCSWGDPREWQQAIFARQLAAMEGWSADDGVLLPAVPPVYLNMPTRVLNVEDPSEAERSVLSVPASLTHVDHLLCSSHAHAAGPVSLWVSLRFLSEAEGLNDSAPIYEPNLMDTGVRFTYYLDPVNFTSAVTGGPLEGGTLLHIDGRGFAAVGGNGSGISSGAENEELAEELVEELEEELVRCRFTDKPSVVEFTQGIVAAIAANASAASAAHPACVPDDGTLAVRFDLPTDGFASVGGTTSGVPGGHEVDAEYVEALLRLHDAGGDASLDPTLADGFKGEWVRPDLLLLRAVNPAAPAALVAYAADGARPVRLSMRQTTHTELRLEGGGSGTVSTLDVPLVSCSERSIPYAPASTLTARVSLVTPVGVSDTRLSCRSPPREAPVLSEVEIALNGEDFHANGIEFGYFVQPPPLVALGPVGAGPHVGGSSVTLSGAGLDAFASWRATGADARCRWAGG